MSAIPTRAQDLDILDEELALTLDRARTAPPEFEAQAGNSLPESDAAAALPAALASSAAPPPDASDPAREYDDDGAIILPFDPTIGANDYHLEPDRPSTWQPPQPRLAPPQPWGQPVDFWKESKVPEMIQVWMPPALGVEDKTYIWTLFDSKVRRALKDEGERVHAKAQGLPPPQKPITDAQRKRLEARIHELNIDRAVAKAYCETMHGRAHFADLTPTEYDQVYAALDTLPTAALKQAQEGAA